MKINLTKERLMVNKFECHSVTVYKREDGTFEAHMHNIVGVTKETPLIDKFTGRQKTDWQGKKLSRWSKKTKIIKSKTFEYSGIEMRKGYGIHKNELYLNATNGEKSNYINYYEPIEEEFVGCGKRFDVGNDMWVTCGIKQSGIDEVFYCDECKTKSMEDKNGKK